MDNIAVYAVLSSLQLRSVIVMYPHIPFTVGLILNEHAVNDADWLNTVRRFLVGLQKRIPMTPVVLLTRMRNLAERHVCELAVELGITVLVLRFSTHGYAVKSLTNAPAIAELIADAELPDAEAERSSTAWLCRHCNLLLAWNSSDKNCNAEQSAVSFRLHSIPPDLDGNRAALFAPEVGPVAIIDAGSRHKSNIFVDSLQFPAGQTAEFLLQRLRELNAFNAEINTLPHARNHVPFEQLLDHDDDADIPKAFSVADRLSRRHQNRLRRRHALLIAVGAAAIMALQLAGMILPTLPMADIYALFFMLLGSGHIWIRKHQAADQYADYRVLAEALRVQYYWRLGGVGDAVSDHFLHKHRERLEWVREALKVFHLKPPAAMNAISERSTAHWIDTQRSYHTNAARRYQRRSLLLARSVWLCYGIGLLLTVLLFCLPGGMLSTGTNNLIGGALGIIASFGTLLLIFSGSMGYGSRASSNRRLAESFDIARTLLMSEIPIYEKIELQRDLGREVLQETSEWIYVQGPP